MTGATLDAASDAVVTFGRTADGLLAARVADDAFGMVPGRNGGFYLTTGWRLSGAIETWTRSDVYGHGGDLADEADFRLHLDRHLEDRRERLALGRRDVRIPASTPWVASQGATIYAEGVVCHSTAGHGGFHLSAERNGKVPSVLRSSSGWYEHDCEWAIVALTFPDLFTTQERHLADRTVCDRWPDAWERLSGRTLQPGESTVKDRHAFEQAHAGDWIVISAIRSDHAPGMTEVIATIGGRRTSNVPERRFPVPSDEYGGSGGRFGFVIDEERHRVYDGPSGFVGWQGRCAP
ncbi:MULTISPECIES: DUF7007 domain-containing protein [unclassified Aureimonas]|uniref:DUF7007 domain-containing protein n=1 Tax=unclassified Aureimonas TaxID=2615206 RepID=UPI0006F6C143|nr:MULTISPECIES: hypothetical protein [unclassified Aureimonas]KQT63285.1 hypothetical protein ASG62_22400 [Aureimonas sp. Leaf427]KQT80136.1 hypothetical protein ASG54_08365 [Aureimonas sp. Leaf460]